MYTVTREVVSTSNERKSGYDSFEDDDPEERYYNGYQPSYKPQHQYQPAINYRNNYQFRNGTDEEIDGDVDDSRVFEQDNGFRSSSSYKCSCCPYGYHVDLGFLQTADGKEKSLNLKNVNSTSASFNGHFQSTGSNPKTEVATVGPLASFGPLGPLNPDGGLQRFETVNVSEDGLTTTRVIEEHTRTTTTTINVLDDDVDYDDERMPTKRMPALDRPPRRPSLSDSSRSNSPDNTSRTATLLRQQQLEELYRRLQEITPIDQSGNHQTYVVTGNEPDSFQEVPKFQTSVKIPAVNGINPEQQRHITQTSLMITQENRLMNDKLKQLENELAGLADENERLRRQVNTISAQSQPYQPMRVLEKELNTEETTEIREKQLKTFYLSGEGDNSLAMASSTFGRGMVREPAKSVRNIGVGDGDVFDNATSSLEVHEHELRTVFIGGAEDGKAKQTRNVGILCRPAMRDVGMVHVSEDSHLVPYKPTKEEEYAYLSGMSLAQAPDGQVKVAGQGEGGEEGSSFFTSAGFCQTSFSSYAGGIGGLKGLNLSPEQLRKLLDEMLKREVHSVGSQCQFSTENKAVDATHSGYDMISIGVSSDSVDVEVIPIRIMKTVAIDHRPSLFHRCCGTDSVYKIDTGTSTRALGMYSNRGVNTDSKVMYPAATNTDASLMPKDADSAATNLGRKMVTTTTKVITSGGGLSSGYSTTKVVTNKSSSSNSSRIGGAMMEDDVSSGFDQSNEMHFQALGDQSSINFGGFNAGMKSVGQLSRVPLEDSQVVEHGGFSSSSSSISPRTSSSRIVEERKNGGSTGGSYTSSSTTIRSGGHTERRSSGSSGGLSRKTVTFQDSGPGYLLGLGGSQGSTYSTHGVGVIVSPPEVSTMRTTETTTESGSKRTVYDSRGGSTRKFNSDGSPVGLRAVVTEYFEPGKTKKVVTETVDKDGKRYVVDSRYETEAESQPLTTMEIEARNLASNAKEIVVTESVGPAGMKKIVTVAIDKDGTRRTIDTRLEPIGDQSERVMSSSSSSSSVMRSQGGKMNIFSEEGSRFTHLSPSLNFYSTWLKDPGSTSAQEMDDTLGQIKENWFNIAAGNDASAENIQAFLLYLGHFSPQLATRIVNMTDSNGNSALHYALSNKRADVVGVLLDSRLCDVDQRNSVGYSAVMMGALCDVTADAKMAESVNKLFKMGNVNATAAEAKQTALMLAAERGRVDTIEILLKCGADVNIQDADGLSALMCAAEHGHENVVLRLLKVPTCKLELLNNDGGSALSISKDAGHPSISKLIEDHLKKHKR